MGWGNLSHNLVLARTYRYERIAMMMIMTRRDSPSLNKSAIAEQENNIDSSPEHPSQIIHQGFRLFISCKVPADIMFRLEHDV